MNVRRLRTLAVLIMGALALTAFACGGSESGGSEATATSTTAPTAAAAVSPTETPGTPAAGTGDLALDTIVAALRSGDAEAIRPLIGFRSVACSTQPGLGGPPKCSAGQSEGDVVEVFMSVQCEGDYRTPDQIDGIASGLAQEELYAVYRVGSDYDSFAEQGFPTQYVAIVSIDLGGPGDSASQLLIGDGQIIGSVSSCVLPAREYVERLGLTDADAVVPPPVQ